MSPLLLRNIQNGSTNLASVHVGIISAAVSLLVWLFYMAFEVRGCTSLSSFPSFRIPSKLISLQWSARNAEIGSGVVHVAAAAAVYQLINAACSGGSGFVVFP